MLNEAEETFIWVVTKTKSRWVRSDLGTEALKREVALLRCGLEPTLVDAAHFPSIADADSPQIQERKRALQARMKFCFDNFSEPKEQIIDGHAVMLPPFDLDRSYKLYKALFGQVEDLIEGKDLLIVPSGPLTQLPFQVLVTKQPDAAVAGLEAMRKAAWLIRDHAITVLPIVSSLKALRELARTSKAKKPYIGFGNPLLDGSPNNAQCAKTARAITSCSTLPAERTACIDSVLLSPTIQRQTDHIDPAALRSLSAVPAGAFELCSVAREQGDAIMDVHLGAEASEAKIKALSASGQLAQYRVVHFNTHGAVAGELTGANEPGLILTPPEKATEDDDGYLSASEVAELKLDADWVVLSACNTAAGGAENAEALSGLARAFFYAGTRALLVSHWAVHSQSTAQLVSAAVGGTAAKGRAKALQAAMIDMIDKGPRPYWAHPTYWAPFVLVGEGGARR